LFFHESNPLDSLTQFAGSSAVPPYRQFTCTRIGYGNERESGGDTCYVCKRSLPLPSAKGIATHLALAASETSSILRDIIYLLCVLPHPLPPNLSNTVSALHKTYTGSSKRIQRRGPNVGRMFHQIPDSLGLITDRHTNSLHGFFSSSILPSRAVIALCKYLHFAHAYRSSHTNRLLRFYFSRCTHKHLSFVWNSI